MSIEALTAVNAAASSTTSGIGSLSAQPAAFGALVDQIAGVNAQMHASQQLLQDVALGEVDNLHQVMMNLERTRLNFDLLLQVRNKLLDAYQEVMRMQV